MVQGLFLRLRHAFQLAAFLGGLLGFLVHLLDEVVGIYYRALAGLHLAFRELHHAVGQVVNLVCPGKAQLFENELKYLEMIVLLVAHHIHVGVQLEIGETALCGAQVLGDVHGCAIPAEHQLAVQAVGREVAPHGAVRVLDKDTLLEALLHQFLAQKVGLTLVVHLVKANAQGRVSLVKAFVHPAVHHGPEFPHMRVSGFPVHQHFVDIVNDFRMLFFHLGIGHIAVSYQVVALFAGALRRGAVEAFFPGIHALADVHAAVVDDGALDNLVAAGLQDAGNAVSQKVVADMSQVQGLVGIGRRELHHDAFSRRRELAEGVIGRDALQGLVPVYRRERQVQEALHAVVGGDFRHIGH